VCRSLPGHAQVHHSRRSIASADTCGLCTAPAGPCHSGSHGLPSSVWRCLSAAGLARAAVCTGQHALDGHAAGQRRCGRERLRKSAALSAL